jgi:hypothetical protein
MSAGCHCLCIANHPSTVGCCTGQRATTLTFDSSVLGLIPVAMCNNCAAATVHAARAERQAPRPPSPAAVSLETDLG